MAVKGCYSCIKYLLFIFNILFWIIGMVILGLGIYYEVEKRSDVVTIVDDSEDAYGGLMIGVGTFIALVGFAGCFGALRENRSCLIFYGTMVTIVFVLQVVAGGLAYRYRDKLDTTVQDGMMRTLGKYTDKSTAIDKAWLYVQGKFECCGVNNYTDWQNSTFTEENPGMVPPSCCDSNVTCAFSHPQNIYQQGCYEKVLNDLRDDWKILAGVGIGIAAVQVFGIFFSCALQANIKKGEYVYV